MGAGIIQMTALEDEDLVGMDQGGQAVADDDHRAAGRNATEVADEDGLALGVERARGLVEDQDARRGQQRARDRQPLALAARQVAGVFLQQGVVALWQALDELVGAGGLGGGHDLLEAGIGARHRDVLAHAAAEHEVVLQHHADAAAQVGEVDFADVDAVEAHHALLHRIEALDQAREGGLARAAAPDHADHGAGRDVQVDAVERGRAGARVAEGDAVERDLALEGRAQTARGPALGRVVHDLAQHLDRERGFLVLVHQADDLHQRADHAVRHHLERDQRADGQLQAEDVERADRDHADHHELFQQLGHGAGGDRHAADAEMHLDAGGRVLVPELALLGLDRQRLDGAHAVDGLDQHRLARALGVVERLQPGVEGLDQQHHDQRHQRREAEHHGRELAAVGHQQRDEQDQADGVERGEEQLPGQEAPDRLHLLHVAHDDASGVALEILDRQRQQLAEGASRQPDVDHVGRVQQQGLAHEAEAGLEQQQADDGHRQHGQGRVALVHQHLVDDQLREDRHAHAEQLQHDGGDRDVAEGLALAQDLGDEPAQSERLVLVEQLVLALEQHQLAGPAAQEIGLLDQTDLAAAGQRVEHGQPRAVVARLHAGDDDRAAVAPTRQQRKDVLELDQFVPAGVDPLRLEAQIGRHAQQQPVVGFTGVERVFMHQPLGQGLDAVMLGNRGQALEGGVAVSGVHAGDLGGGLFRQGP